MSPEARRISPSQTSRKTTQTRNLSQKVVKWYPGFLSFPPEMSMEMLNKTRVCCKQDSCPPTTSGVRGEDISWGRRNGVRRGGMM